MQSRTCTASGHHHPAEDQTSSSRLMRMANTKAIAAKGMAKIVWANFTSEKYFPIPDIMQNLISGAKVRNNSKFRSVSGLLNAFEPKPPAEKIRTIIR